MRLPLAFSLAALLVAPAFGAPRRPPPARKASPAPARAAAPPAARPERVTPANLGAVLARLGYRPVAEGAYQRLRVEEERFGYAIDLSFSPSGRWLVCMAHLAAIPDLTRAPAAPLLSLLAANDSLLGMAFSYHRESGRIMLNAAVPAAALEPAALAELLERMKDTVRRTQGLWDPTAW